MLPSGRSGVCWHSPDTGRQQGTLIALRFIINSILVCLSNSLGQSGPAWASRADCKPTFRVSTSASQSVMSLQELIGSPSNWGPFILLSWGSQSMCRAAIFLTQLAGSTWLNQTVFLPNKINWLNKENDGPIKDPFDRELLIKFEYETSDILSPCGVWRYHRIGVKEGNT